ncbi:MAG: ATP-binding protein, partial [Bacteroidales bacterium]|nr:ATP-binding protein [Bacteroidales bacterium]
ISMNYPDPIDPRKLDLVMRDHDHAIYYADKVLSTPNGKEIADPDIRLLKHILAKLTIYGEINVFSVNSFALFCYHRDYIEQGEDRLLDGFANAFNDDPLVKLILGKGTSLLDAEKALSYLEDHPAVLNLIFWGMPEVGRRLKVFVDELTEGKGGDLPEQEEMLSVIKESYEGLMDAQKAAINLLSCIHTSGMMLPLMLLMGKMTPSEYATAAMAINLGYEMRGDAPEACKLYSREAGHFKVDRKQPELAYKELHSHAIKALEHISFFTGRGSELEPGIRDLIGAGESYNLEFKTSLRWDVRQEKKNPAIEHASLKTISAFLNSSGGHLLIGVEDNGRVEGVEIDKFENDDKFLLHFWNLVKSSMGQEVTPYIRSKLEKVDGGTVCHVRCVRSPAPVFLRQKGFGEEFYIRTGPSSASLEIREALKYISERFPSK